MTERPTPGLPPAPPADPAPSPGAERRMVEFLVCPVTRGPLVLDSARRELVSRNAGLAFPIQDGIPVMLVDEARRLD